MEDAMAVAEGKEPVGSQTQDAGSPSLARGAAGIEGGEHADIAQDNLAEVRKANPEGDIEERRETQQVLRPSTDGVGEGLTKDAG
jgi:hypothetical protein